ncbi:MAG: hypothetical protein LBC74_07225 [Planctomycetaceae bacterium]|nr:hypothetical protein [Planctomycetaceae bacterium]
MVSYRLAKRSIRAVQKIILFCADVKYEQFIVPLIIKLQIRLNENYKIYTYWLDWYRHNGAQYGNAHFA